MGQDTYANVGVSVELKLIIENLPIICRLLSKGIDCYIHPGECDDEITSFVDLVQEVMNEGRDEDEDEDEGTDEDSDGGDDCDGSDGSECIDDNNSITTYLLQITTPVQIEELGLPWGSPLHFMISVTDAYARNISRRENPYIYGTNDESVDDIVNRFIKAKQDFIDLGLSPDQIKVSYTMSNAY